MIRSRNGEMPKGVRQTIEDALARDTSHRDAFHIAAVQVARLAVEFLKDRPIGESKRSQRRRLEAAVQRFEDAEVRLEVGS